MCRDGAGVFQLDIHTHGNHDDAVAIWSSLARTRMETMQNVILNFQSLATSRLSGLQYLDTEAGSLAASRLVIARMGLCNIYPCEPLWALSGETDQDGEFKTATSVSI